MSPIMLDDMRPVAPVPPARPRTRAEAACFNAGVLAVLVIADLAAEAAQSLSPNAAAVLRELAESGRALLYDTGPGAPAAGAPAGPVPDTSPSVPAASAEKVVA